MEPVRVVAGVISQVAQIDRICPNVVACTRWEKKASARNITRQYCSWELTVCRAYTDGILVIATG